MLWLRGTSRPVGAVKTRLEAELTVTEITAFKVSSAEEE